jgi:hypothetical protein
VVEIMPLAREAPANAQRPITHWSGRREIAEETRQRGIVEQISPRHAARLLKNAQLKPHLIRSWLTPEEADERFDEKVAAITSTEQWRNPIAGLTAATSSPAPGSWY